MNQTNTVYTTNTDADIYTLANDFFSVLEKFTYQDAKANKFREWCLKHASNIQKIINAWSSNGLDAFAGNDFYKATMAPVIAACEKTFGPICTTWDVNIRDASIADLLTSKDDESETLRRKIYHSLKALCLRRWDPAVFTAIESKCPGFVLSPEDQARIIANGCLANDIFYDMDFTKISEAKQEQEPDKVCIYLSVRPDNLKGKDKFYIEVIGPWSRSSWLETSVMQCVYETILHDELEQKGKSFSQWLIETMYNCFLSIDLANNNASRLKILLMSGRRTGSMLFNWIQGYMLSVLCPGCIGMSSISAWYALNNIKFDDIDGKLIKIVPLAGTHAHELCMVGQALFSNLDTDLPASQLFMHWLYFKLVWIPGKARADEMGLPFAPMPALSDTISTSAYINTASIILVMDPKYPRVIDIIEAARHDSGSPQKFAELFSSSSTYPGFTDPILIASEIGSFGDLEAVNSIPAYKVAGIGGWFENAKHPSLKVEPFKISMATKAVKVHVFGKDFYPFKIGDSGMEKFTVATDLEQDQIESIRSNGHRLIANALNIEGLGEFMGSLNETFSKYRERFGV